MPSGRRRRSSSGTCTGPSTPTPRGTPPGSRPSPTAGCKSASRATAWPSPTTRPTATTSAAPPALTAGRPRSCGSRCCAPRSSPTPDQGEHRMRVSLRVGATIADAVAEGYRLNLPPRTVRGGSAIAPLVSVDSPALVVEAVKLAEDGSGDVIVRLYEAHGTRAAARITAGFEHTGVVETDLLERPLAEPVALSADGTRLRLRPFRIVTLRYRRG